MPLYLSVPLPGPFRWSPRIRRCRRRRFDHAWYWLSGAFMLELCCWLLLAEVALIAVICRGAVNALRLLCDWRDRRHPGP